VWEQPSDYTEPVTAERYEALQREEQTRLGLNADGVPVPHADSEVRSATTSDLKPFVLFLLLFCCCLGT
jgi:hypothetical protein